MTNEGKEQKRRTGKAAITQLSQSGLGGIGRGGINLLFQLGESNHLISSNCNESISSGES